MHTRPGDWVEPGDPVKAKNSTHRALQLVVGAIAFIGAGLAVLFLLFQGGLLLGIAFLVELITHMGPQSGGQDGGPILMLPALMVVGGLCLAVGLLDIAFRAAMGKPFPEASTVMRFGLIALTLVVATAIAVVVWTRTM